MVHRQFPSHLLVTRHSVARPDRRNEAPGCNRSWGPRGTKRRSLTPKGPEVSDLGKRESIEQGRAGASAWAEYERRHEKDDARRRARFGPLAPLVRVLAGPKASTEAWARGAEGEEHVGHLLDHFVGSNGVVLHDRRVPGRRLNLDHLVVVASGVWVIDTKHYHGHLARRRVGGSAGRRLVQQPGSAHGETTRPESPDQLGATAAGHHQARPGSGRPDPGRAVLLRRRAVAARPTLRHGGSVGDLAQDTGQATQGARCAWRVLALCAG
jgi:hypothetical protein